MQRKMTTTQWKDLPDDVAADILSRFPVKTIMRLRCVCKSWCLIISHPSFISKHLNRACLYNNNNNVSLQYLKISFGPPIWCICSDEKDVHLEIPFPCREKNFSFVGGFNGLVCISYVWDFGRTIYLWNPSIRKYKTLSCLSTTLVPQLSHIQNHVVLGFGFHSQTNDCKIVRILYCKDVNRRFILNSPPLVEVYTLSTNSWKKIETYVPCFTFDQELNAFVNGSVHWVASRSVEDTQRRDMIMSFDFGGEVFGEMRLPNYSIVGDEWVDLRLAVLKESLSLCVCYGTSGHCGIWVMMEYGVAESWTKQFTIGMPQGKIRRSLGFTMNNELVLETRDRDLVSYDLEGLRCRYLGIYKDKCSSNVFPFVESLVLL